MAYREQAINWLMWSGIGEGEKLGTVLHEMPDEELINLIEYYYDDGLWQFLQDCE